jgi:Amt family ammonium transporter
MLSLINNGDTAWVLMSTGLVLFMVIGLAFFYGGMVRSQHVLNMILQNVLCIGIVTVTWLVAGFSLSFGGRGRYIGNFSLAGVNGLDMATLPGFVGNFSLTVPNYAFFHYHMMFAIITPALITGATADRLKMKSWALLVFLWSLLVYPPVCKWIFSPVGWFARQGALDFAGGAVVHTSAGAAALAILLVIGPRHGWPEHLKMRPNSMPLVLLGTGILWFGWFGFNAGSALGANLLAVHALVNTQVAGAAGLTMWLVAERIKGGSITSLGAASGAIAGLAAVTPAAGYVQPFAALGIGAAAGVICCFATELKFVFKYDDALDVVGVHLVGGVFGTLCVGLFADATIKPGIDNGLFNGGGWHLFGLQAMMVGATFLFAFGMTFILAISIHRTIGLRASAEEEDRGLDLSELAETAYLHTPEFY